MIKHRCFFNCRLKILFCIIVGVYLTIVPVSFKIPQVRANGPIPFSENFDTFADAGFDSNPAAGQLDSDLWVVTGLSDGDGTFGGSHIGGDFARGLSNGGVGTGGIYAFDVGGGNTILGIQSGGNDFTPGDIILRLQNNTGSTITQLDVSYDIWYLNDQPRANALNISHSPDDLTYTPVATLDFTTPELTDALGWQSTPRSITLTGLNIPNGSYFYLKWTGNDVSGGGSRDEFGLDNVQVSVPVGDAPPTVSTTTPPDTATGVAVDTNITINFSEAVTATNPWFTLTCSMSGGQTATVSGGPQSYTLNPDTDFANSEVCTITVLAAQITDQDGTPDTMSSNYSFSFATVAPPAAWIINEIHADPDAAAGDANGDGAVDTGQDEFVEIINNTGTPADISGWTLSDGVGVKHTFPPGTELPDQCAILLFGGGTPTGSFGDALVQTAGSLGLNNGGDTVTLADGGGATLAAYTYGNEGGDNQSLTRSPDMTGPEPLVKHTAAAGAGGTLFSPGTAVDGSKFSGCSRPRVIGNTPAAGATGVAVNSPITLQFSELVTTTASSFSLDCSGPVSFNVSPPSPGNADTFSLTPATPMPNSTTCTVTVAAPEITDQDDIPETMAANHVFTFTTTGVFLPIIISEFVYDGLTPSTEGDEFVQT